jgi:hypothetical protein
MPLKLTILQLTDRLEKIAKVKELNRAILPPFRKNLKIMQRALFAEYWSNRFGARIWRWTTKKFAWTTSGRSGGSVFTGRKSGPAVKLGTRKRRQYARWSHTQGAYIAQINIEGLAAKMELGGRLRRHVPYGRESAAYKPGLRVPTNRKFDRVVEQKLWPRTVEDISRDFWKFIERTL